MFINDINICLAPQTRPTDIANSKREERNTQQWKQRAEMADEQREEINRKQREYRARKKAALQDISITSIVSQIVPASSSARE